jgi:signal transduction histidine kinase
MSTIAVNREARPHAFALGASLERRGVMACVGVSALVVAAGGGLLLATSEHLAYPIAYGLEVAVIVVLSVSAALYWAVQRPGNRIALVLLAYAAATAVVSLEGSASPLLFSVGVLFEMPAFLLMYYLLLAFPEGRLVGKLEQALFVALAWTGLASFVPWFFFSPVVGGGSPQGGCTSCPGNPLMIADKPGIASGFGTWEDYFAMVVEAAIAAGLLYRLARSSRPRRRSLVPVYVPGLLLTIPLAVFRAHTVGLLALDAQTAKTLGWVVTAGRISLSLGFLVAIWQAMLFAGVALKTIMRRLGQEQDAAHLRELVAEALDDPVLELEFEVSPGSGFFVDSHGHAFDEARAADDGRSTTALHRDGEIVGYIVHDPALDTDPELLEAAGQSVVLALESGRLESELQSRTTELQSSRARIVETADRERLRLERDLHDGAQQRLMAIQIKLAFAQDLPAGDDLVEQLQDVQADAAAAVEDLRTLARGIYPSVLRERGVADALRSLAMTAPIPIEVNDDGLGRCSAPIEVAIYFCSLEAIQNAIKHAGPGARVTVDLGRRGGKIDFMIADDGVGMGARSAPDGVGLTSMRDRIGAVGGRLEITSRPGQGTHVRGAIPDGAPVPASIEFEDTL